jgi:hypothetical protein
MRMISSFLQQSKLSRKIFYAPRNLHRTQQQSFIRFVGVSHFCSKSKPPPEEFYDEEVEKDKELFDIYEVRQKGRSFETLTTNKV